MNASSNCFMTLFEQLVLSKLCVLVVINLVFRFVQISLRALCNSFSTFRRTSLSADLKSMVNRVWPGITFEAPGFIDISPTVTTVFGEFFANSSIFIMHSLAVTRASCLRSSGTVPA